MVKFRLAPHVGAFVAHLGRGRYAANTTKGYVASIAHFTHWMTQFHPAVRIPDQGDRGFRSNVTAVSD